MSTRQKSSAECGKYSLCVIPCADGEWRVSDEYPTRRSFAFAINHFTSRVKCRVASCLYTKDFSLMPTGRGRLFCDDAIAVADEAVEQRLGILRRGTARDLVPIEIA